ncbi:hypothetical protein P154DRAFT_518344 [Amniculicola lignicola CBS 123094]|uniref:Uncharacterized protein n=1 Tax=Amniculicola lignicola CBS 123094 TaxID=1392246 RepID=A0A6A5WVF4_9PLEO|nr:hypothetical protein P154DRAFT_518344 [Amniculicola lignicola CBS 123094]
MSRCAVLASLAVALRVVACWRVGLLVIGRRDMRRNLVAVSISRDKHHAIMPCHRI